MAQTSHDELLADIGRDYYVEGKSKVEIATRHGISRFQVARLLDEARQSGIVEITIHSPGRVAAPSAAELQSRLGLDRVIITRSSPDVHAARDILGKAVADELSATARAGTTVGIAWSRTLDVASKHVTTLPTCDIVQLAGALPVPGSGNSLQLIQRMGQISGSRTWPIWAPLVVADAATAAGLRRQPEIAAALAKADALDLAVVAIGAWAPQLSTVWDRVSNTDRSEAAAAGAIAECSGRLFDASGRSVSTDLDNRVMAATIAQLRNTPKVIGVARGAELAAAVVAAASSGLITTLVADEALAAALAATNSTDPTSTDPTAEPHGSHP